MPLCISAPESDDVAWALGAVQYPFEAQLLLRKRRKLRRLLRGQECLVEKRIAILGGSTTHDVREMIELFLLSYGIRPTFYESEFGQWWEDAVFGNAELDGFAPDVVYIHTSTRNIAAWPDLRDSCDDVEELLDRQFQRFAAAWEAVSGKFGCPIVQCNFEQPFFRLMGNRDAVDVRGRASFVNRLNERIAEWARSHDGFHVNDVNWQSADYGLREWSAPYWWHMYKYSCCLDAIPTLAFNVANIVKSLFGKNKKALALDLDNTLWGGVVGDDGVEGLAIGQETSQAQAFTEVQGYLKAVQAQGVILNVVSKNERENAIAGISHPDMVLKESDFIAIKANWNPKSENIAQIAREVSLLPESFVFVDDNPAEREIVRQQLPGVGIPVFGAPEECVAAIDRAGYFEVTALSADDLNRNDMYRQNAQRAQLQSSFADYSEYLRSLEMTALIRPFEGVYMERIAQLTNKSNQFNLTTRRYTQEEIEAVAGDPSRIALYGRLEDKFGDNGVVTVVIGKEDAHVLDIELWLMSCRVLKRDMELAMLDALAAEATARGCKALRGHYLPTKKNGMVRGFFGDLGFRKVGEDGEGNTDWELDLAGYENRNRVIDVAG